jgi:hypothetical protein
MPREIEIYSVIVLFGIRVAFRSNDKRAMEVALALYPEWKGSDTPQDGDSIYIVLTAYDVNRLGGDLHHAETHLLTIERKGIVIRGDGAARRGSCGFVHDTGDEELADLINTLVLFLIGHAGRVPLHASAVMLENTAIVFAGASGAGKSTLALAAIRAGLPLLSDDTIFVQTKPGFRIWSLAGPIHVFEKDAPQDMEGGMRFRGGRWKKSLAAPERRRMADRAILCVLEPGEDAALMTLPRDEAVAALTVSQEPGYQFYGEASVLAARALAASGAWQLILSADPMEAIALIRRHFAPGSGISFHSRYVALVAQIERRFAVAEWKSGDADLWPLARFDLYLDMYWDNVGAAPPEPRPWPLRLAGRTLKPFLNLWRSRYDLGHWRCRAKPAPVIFLGDGVSLDRVSGAYQDRQGEPVMAALERRGHETFLMQSGELVRLPWRRTTFAANLVDVWGWIISPLFVRPAALPDHKEVMAFLVQSGVRAPSLERASLIRRAQLIHAAAFLFERLLKRVRPKLAFVVSYYAGLGPAFVLACWRRRIVSVDLQHAPLEGAPMAYVFDAYPQAGYSVLPVLFWSWTQKDADSVRHGPHQSLRGGPPQLADFVDDAQSFDGGFEREILVALQPIAGHRDDWEALARQIEASPPSWRWWIRRHPASRPDQDREFGRLINLCLPNVRIAEASAMPLPALLRRMSAVLSLASGTAMEAALFGVPAFFLSEEARGPFGAFIESGAACVIDPGEVRARIAGLQTPPVRRFLPPDLEGTLTRLEELADEYQAAREVIRDRVNDDAPRCAERSKPV